MSRRPKAIEIGHITARAVKRYPANGKPYYVRADGCAYWQARAKGSRTTVWSGWASRDDAMAQLARLAARREGQKAAPTTGLVRTVQELMEAWVAHQRWRQGQPKAMGGIRPKTLDFYEKAARHLLAWLGEVRVSALTAEVVHGYVQDRLSEQASERLVKSEVARLRQAYRWGAEKALVPDRSFPKVQVKVDERRFVINHRTPSQQEVLATLAELSGDVRLAVLLLATTGARVGEVGALTGADLDPSSGALRLVGKTGPRTFPLRSASSELFEELARRASEAPEGPLLPGLGTRAPEEKIRCAIRRACARAGIPRFTPHGLRRYVVNRLLDAKVDLKVAASITGHSVEVMLRFYRGATSEARAIAVADAGLALSGAAC